MDIMDIDEKAGKLTGVFKFANSPNYPSKHERKDK